MSLRGAFLGLWLLPLAGVGGSSQQDSGRAGQQQDLTRPARTAIQRGIRWLLKNQNRDGSWGIDGRGSGDVTCTALGAMALMAGGNTDRSGPSVRACESVRRALEWIMQKARIMRRGNIVGSNTTLIQSKLGNNVHTFFATVFLTQAYGLGTRWLGDRSPEEIRSALVEMAHAIAQNQEADGSWHKQTFGSLKATTMAWMALRSARSAGIRVDDASIEKTLKFIRSRYDPTSGLFQVRGRSHGYQTLYASTSAVRILFGMGKGSTQEANNGAAAVIKYVREGPMAAQFLSVEGEDYMSAWLLTSALIQDRRGLWREWFPFIREKLLKKQNQDGSWTGTACISGRMFATSCSLLCLQVPFRHLPIQEE